MAFIVFEGLDGAGKSTLIKGLAEVLRSKGKTVTVTREPGGTQLGEEIRHWLLEDGPRAPLPRAELFLYEADRAQHVEQVIRPALKRGDWVLCDRFTSSTLAFQCGGRGLDEDMVNSLNEMATGGLHPDLFVFLQVSVEVSEQRRSNRQKLDRFEQEKADFHTRVLDQYLSQVAKAPESWLVLNGEAGKPKELGQQLVEALEARQWL